MKELYELEHKLTHPKPTTAPVVIGCSDLLAQITLKRRLKIKKLTKFINDAVRDNFGYCPSYKRFNEAITERITLKDEAREFDAEWCCLFDDYDAKELGQNTPTYIS